MRPSPHSARRLLVTLVLVTLDCSVAACGEANVTPLDWRVVFASEADRERAVMVEASIFNGECEDLAQGERLYRTEVRDARGGGMRPPALPAGRYAFVARARDARCVWYVQGCEPLHTSRPGAEVVVRLANVTSEPACSVGECTDGTCAGIDMDAGSPVEGGIDADSSPPGDAATGDAATPDGATTDGRVVDAGRDGGDQPPVSGCTAGSSPVLFLPSNLSGCGALADDVSGTHTFGEGRFFFNTDTGQLSLDLGSWVTIRSAGQGSEPLMGCGDGSCGSISYYQRPPLHEGGAPLGIFVVGGLVIEGPVRIVAGGERALVIVSLGAIEIDGDLVAGASGDLDDAPGGPSTPPGGEESPGSRAGSGSTGNGQNGGGGGGFGSAGGEGAPDVPGGVAHGRASLVPLIGGSAGGEATGGGAAARGGAGGGAVQLVAGLRITIGGRVDASGGGGGGGIAGDTGGGGGGSGGAILLEAPEVVLGSRSLLRTAGGGGGGGASSGSGGVAGEAGSVGTCPVPGGPGSGDAGGGTGSCSASPGGDGNDDFSGGGGGGGAGRIRINHDGSLTSDGTLVPDPGSSLFTTGTLAR